MKKIRIKLENNQFTINGIVDLAERIGISDIVVVYSPRIKPEIDYHTSRTSMSSYLSAPEPHHTYKLYQCLDDVPEIDFQQILPVYASSGCIDKVVCGYLVLIKTVIV